MISWFHSNEKSFAVYKPQISIAREPLELLARRGLSVAVHILRKGMELLRKPKFYFIPIMNSSITTSNQFILLINKMDVSAVFLGLINRASCHAV